MTPDVPEMLQEYGKYCSIRDSAIKTGVIDLSSYSWFYPTCLILLSSFRNENQDFHYIEPDLNVENYINVILKSAYSDNSSYVPMTYFSKHENRKDRIIDILQTKYENGSNFGGPNAFNFLMNELIDNIYTHSEFTNACVMAQQYKAKGFVEISIHDNGITIPSCFEKHGIEFSGDCDAIQKAISGTSTKDKTRGFGLNRTIKMYTDDVNDIAEFLLVSRNGAIYKNKNDTGKFYSLKEPSTLHGTLISIRLSYPATKIDAAQYY